MNCSVTYHNVCVPLCNVPFCNMYFFMTMYRFVTVPFWNAVPFCIVPFCNVLLVMYRYGTYRCVTYYFVMYRYVSALTRSTLAWQLARFMFSYCKKLFGPRTGLTAESTGFSPLDGTLTDWMLSPRRGHGPGLCGAEGGVWQSHLRGPAGAAPLLTPLLDGSSRCGPRRGTVAPG